MSKNIEMNALGSDGNYEIIYPKTKQELVIDLLNDNVKTLMGLDSTATANDAFKKVFLSSVLNGKSMIELTFLDSETNKPLPNMKVTSAQFCDSAGTSISEIFTDDNGVLVSFVNSVNPTINISGYADIQEYSQVLDVTELGKQYYFTLYPTVLNYNLIKSSQSIKFTGNIDYIDFTIVGGGGG